MPANSNEPILSKGSKKAINNVPKKGFLNMAKEILSDIIIAITIKGVSLKKYKETIATITTEIKESSIVFKLRFFIGKYFLKLSYHFFFSKIF